MPAFQEYFDPSHELVRDSVRRFVEREILPDIAQWEEAEGFPRELYAKAGANRHLAALNLALEKAGPKASA